MVTSLHVVLADLTSAARVTKPYGVNLFMQRLTDGATGKHYFLRLCLHCSSQRSTGKYRYQEQ